MASSALDSRVDDEVIKRRLIFDGDGVGDDRKLIGLTKSFINWCMADESEEDCHVSYRRLVSQVNQAEFAAERTHYSISINEKVQIMYTNLKKQVQDGIEDAKSQILACKHLLEEATKHRKYSKEYAALTKLIEGQPDRKETEAKLRELKEELESLRSRKNSLDARLEIRKKNLFILIPCIQRLEELLKEDEDLDRAQKALLEAKTKLTPNKSVEAVAAVVEYSPIFNLSNDEPCNPVEQVSPEVPNSENTFGTITLNYIQSAPVSPPEECKSEKYEDLSESETD